VGRGFGRVILLGIVMFQSAVWIQAEGGGLSRQRRGSLSVGHIAWDIIITYWKMSHANPESKWSRQQQTNNTNP